MGVLSSSIRRFIEPIAEYGSIRIFKHKLYDIYYIEKNGYLLSLTFNKKEIEDIKKALELLEKGEEKARRYVYLR